MNTRTLLAAWPAILALALTGCGAASSPNTPSTGSSAGHEAEHKAQSGEDQDGTSEGFGHVHGLGVNPADDRLYVATHLDVFKQTDSGFVRVADRYQDTMAFTVTGPDRFLASGHPDLREDKPPHLGLIESTDAAVTWQALSLEGTSDFHALEPAGELLYGYDSNNGVVKVTQDRKMWRNVARGSFVDLAANPTDPTRVLATDERGRLVDLSRGREPTPVPAPRLVFVDWPRTGLLVGVGPDGTVYRSTSAGASWAPVATLGSRPEALEVTGTRWLVATTERIVNSTDSGATWSSVPG